MNSDVLMIDKPTDMTSFGVVARIRRVLTEHKRNIHEQTGECPTLKNGHCRCKVKVGHTGTLDPFATGLMIVVVRKETKNAAVYSKLDKVYEAELGLGATSSTGDPEGLITQLTPQKPMSHNIVERVLEQFVGEIQQTPPIYSAIKIHGERAYKLARKGQEIEMPVRTITIYKLELLSYDYPRLVIRAHVSSGTYIRTLAEDIGKALGTGAYCTALRRTKVGEWSVDGAMSLEAAMETVA